MIGKLVEHIIEAGFNVCVINIREDLVVFRIAGLVKDEMVSSELALSRLELKTAREAALMPLLDMHLDYVRQAIAERKGVEQQEVSDEKMRRDM